ncbi:hypothetical protein P4O66_000779 [Electrophorus voltai]|uniref:Uncharacterized protein n=1 Tax=Electrophorus voltai TaxID=2609070 RepID=A0AAD8ZEH9_9TELE|nr:hypothetical protein P4O66_000779 [Electrophorus voltai]
MTAAEIGGRPPTCSALLLGLQPRFSVTAHLSGPYITPAGLDTRKPSELEYLFALAEWVQGDSTQLWADSHIMYLKVVRVTGPVQVYPLYQRAKWGKKLACRYVERSGAFALSGLVPRGPSACTGRPARAKAWAASRTGAPQCWRFGGSQHPLARWARGYTFDPGAVDSLHSRLPPWQLEDRSACVTMATLPRDRTPLAVAGLVICLLSLCVPVVVSQRLRDPTEASPTPAAETQPECARQEHPVISVQGTAQISKARLESRPPRSC